MTHLSAAGPAAWPTEFQALGPISLVASSRFQAANGVCALALQPTASAAHVHLVNAYTISLAARDKAYAEALSGSAVNLPDGKPLAVLSRWRRHTRPLHQVRGPQLFLDVFDVGREYDIRHFLLGSTPETLRQLETTLSMRYPGCRIVGSESPPFRSLTDVELESQDRRIKQAKPDIVWVGLGTPKQDWEARRVALSTGAVTIAVGAAFDFAAGTVKEAPIWIRSIGFEWFFRLCSEPKRLWRRYLFGNFQFLLIAYRDVKENGWNTRK